MAHPSAASNHPRPTSPTSIAAHDFASDTSESGGDAPLPFPAALPRSDFLVPDFDPAAYLSALPHRHQTLEDLRSDLRDRSSTISSELLELVNSNYTAFLSLGSELKGGDEKVEDVRVALLGFRRAVEEIKANVAKKSVDTRQLNDELRHVRTSIEQGRKMLELSDRLDALEERLTVNSTPAGAVAETDWESDSDDDEGGNGPAEGFLASSPSKLLKSAAECGDAVILQSSLDQQHPFVIKMRERLTKCRSTLLLDLGNALKEAKGAGAKGHDRLLKYLDIYRMLDAQREAVKVLRSR
ncbi:uncharacterized protein UV8b_06657 [Ustilaginoidea virens]|uniref:Conserved oligomeric Golgi complex subunit 2 n=1 Tax=Ustilaginoidea virens TaxID=1159556 RepID=A0A063BWQ4_USTVR|nr:uncharacterized protein UV8b_06657 [Ustilaginoidea virens]QUC22416.1 hypothetical protein UV8b_06657 [Ustilaginoidea virens]GAO16955.1 hypothetical protein UVI_02054850 [Ustilaginoidea virens]